MQRDTWTYDWAAMIEQLNAAGIPDAEIAKQTQTVLTRQMVKCYKDGVQPLYWRGQLMLDLWCAVTEQTPDQAPKQLVKRGYRVAKQLVTGPRVQALPDWPRPKITASKLINGNRQTVAKSR